MSNPPQPNRGNANRNRRGGNQVIRIGQDQGRPPPSNQHGTQYRQVFHQTRTAHNSNRGGDRDSVRGDGQGPFYGGRPGYFQGGRQDPFRGNRGSFRGRPKRGRGGNTSGPGAIGRAYAQKFKQDLIDSIKFPDEVAAPAQATSPGPTPQGPTPPGTTPPGLTPQAPAAARPPPVLLPLDDLFMKLEDLAARIKVNLGTQPPQKTWNEELAEQSGKQVTKTSAAAPAALPTAMAQFKQVMYARTTARQVYGAVKASARVLRQCNLSQEGFNARHRVHYMLAQVYRTAAMNNPRQSQYHATLWLSKYAYIGAPFDCHQFEMDLSGLVGHLNRTSVFKVKKLVDKRLKAQSSKAPKRLVQEKSVIAKAQNKLKSALYVHASIEYMKMATEGVKDNIKHPLNVLYNRFIPMRSLNVSMVMIAHENGVSQMFKTDLAVCYSDYRSSAVVVKSVDAQNHLEKKLKKKLEYGNEEAIQQGETSHSDDNNKCPGALGDILNDNKKKVVGGKDSVKSEQIDAPTTNGNEGRNQKPPEPTLMQEKGDFKISINLESTGLGFYYYPILSTTVKLLLDLFAPAYQRQYGQSLERGRLAIRRTATTYWDESVTVLQTGVQHMGVLLVVELPIQTLQKLVRVKASTNPRSEIEGNLCQTAQAVKQGSNSEQAGNSVQVVATTTATRSVLAACKHSDPEAAIKWLDIYVLGFWTPKDTACTKWAAYVACIACADDAIGPYQTYLSQILNSYRDDCLQWKGWASKMVCFPDMKTRAKKLADCGTIMQQNDVPQSCANKGLSKGLEFRDGNRGDMRKVFIQNCTYEKMLGKYCDKPVELLETAKQIWDSSQAECTEWSSDAPTWECDTFPWAIVGICVVALVALLLIVIVVVVICCNRSNGGARSSARSRGQRYGQSAGGSMQPVGTMQPVKTMQPSGASMQPIQV